MAHYRSVFRATVRAALEAHADFTDFEAMSAFSKSIDVERLPVLAVATPRETKQRETHGQSERTTQLVVVCKVLGGADLEDDLDDLSETVEIVTLDALETSGVQVELTQTDIDIDSKGEASIGALSMTFDVKWWPVEPLTPA